MIAPSGTPPRLGFIGLGWIGAMRLDAVAAAGAGVPAALCDAAAERLDSLARTLRTMGVDGAEPGCFTDPEDLLRHAADLRLDGVVIATPNALHAPQALAALERGLAVFCQKPLALSGEETRRLLDGARAADRLLGVDYTYRTLASAAELRRLVRAGDLGRAFSVDAVFHNGYGPDKAWCFDPSLAGGGALLDLGVHLLDLAFWLTEARQVHAVSGAVFKEGRPLRGRAIDDFATARIDFEAGTGERASASLAVSWNAHAGRDCTFRVSLFGTAGGAELRNVGGSFYDFELARFSGRCEEVVARDSGESLGRGIVAWAERLAGSRRFDPEAVRSLLVSDTVDAIYGEERSLQG
jgi:predicted dehydrogenase